MKIKNLGLDSTIPYKLSNIVYHFEKFLYNYSGGKTLKEYKSFIKENDLETLILTKTPSVLLDSVIERIMVGDWDEISYNMDYSNSDKLLLDKFFRLIYPDYVNKTKDWEEFYKQLLQDNLNDLVIEEGNDFNANAYYTISNSISLEIEIADSGDALRIKYNNDISDWLPIEYKIDEYSDNEEDTIPYVMYGEMEIDLNNVMRIDNNYFENEITTDTLINDDLPYRIGQTVEFDDLNDNGFLVKNTGVIENITNSYYLINVGTKKIKYALGQKMEVLNDSDIDDKFGLDDWKIAFDTQSINQTDKSFLQQRKDLLAKAEELVKIIEENPQWASSTYSLDGVDHSNEFKLDVINLINYMQNILSKYDEEEYLINDGTKDIKYALGQKMEVLNNDDDLDYDNYEIEINTLDILNKYQEEKSLKGNAEFTLESDDNTYQVEFEYLNNSNQLNLFDIETLDGIVVEFNKNNLEIIKNEIIHQLNMYNELNIEDNKKLFSEEDNSHNKLILSTIFDSEINFNEFIERIENHIFDDKSSQNIRNIIYGGFTTQDKINEIGKFIFNNLTELVNNIFDYSDFEKENLLNNFGDDEREEIFYQLSKDIANFENNYVYVNEDDGLDEEELENERPFQPEDQNLLLTILDNLDKNFPIPRVEFYYPFENVECSTLMSLEKINNFLSVENEDYESIMVVDDYKLVSLMPDIIEFEDLLRRLYTNIPDSNLENGEDILYMNLSDGTNSIKLKIYISGELHDILAN